MYITYLKENKIKIILNFEGYKKKKILPSNIMLFLNQVYDSLLYL